MESRARRRVPRRVDGIETKNRIKLAAVELFSNSNFSSVSISQITKKAELSAGAFYQYYINKEELFREIVEEFFQQLEASIVGDTLSKSGVSFLEFCRNNAKLVKVVHLNEYFFEWIRNEFESILRKVSKRFGLTSVGHFYFWSPLRFVAAFSDLVEAEINNEEFVRFVMSGPVDGCVEDVPQKAFDFSPERHVIEIDERREQILANAETLFGTYGYDKTQVYDIVRACGMAVGTFYLYFKNKLEVLHELVRWISKGLRYNVKLAVEKCRDCPRLVQEIAGLYAFVKFFKMHFNMYKIVRESQSIDVAIAREYYGSIYHPYTVALSRAIEEGKLKPKVSELNRERLVSYLALMLMSYGHFIGERFLLSGVIDEQDNGELENFLEELFVYICKGLEDVHS
ncbi:TetR/AcrR family transcriptional regulator [Fervidobacterium thailandense]|uniref:TetR family transcriptional regulator n=1 Tax=Fervidobacterium thailandense TaxID=1008305 RepID=A0A1E3G0G8_9BACT|nr:TetR/AcrR family transcriptional regulator [Fervidobacterium thailandense]ODN29715.1 TetR family transcriptional regulator [Fervidobacterium thailandense]